MLLAEPYQNGISKEKRNASYKYNLSCEQKKTHTNKYRFGIFEKEKQSQQKVR